MTFAADDEAEVAEQPGVAAFDARRSWPSFWADSKPLLAHGSSSLLAATHRFSLVKGVFEAGDRGGGCGSARKRLW